ncbi:MAG: hypothetical protein AAF480_18875 [Actinomycetota bacterium]
MREMPMIDKGVRRTSVVLALVAAALVVAGSPAAADTGGGFDCQPGLYQVISGQLRDFNPGAGTFDPMGPAHGDRYNAMGYRIADDYLYAFERGGTDLLRISADGTVVDMGQVAMSATSPYTGDFGPDGRLWVSRGGANWYAIDVDTLEAEPIPYFGASEAVADVVLIGGVFWGVSASGRLWSFDPGTQTQSVTTGVVDGLEPTTGYFGAAWTANEGQLYVSRNSGFLYQITGYLTASPLATEIADHPATNSNDGASCPNAPAPEGVTVIEDPTVPEPTPTPIPTPAPTPEPAGGESYEIPDAGLGEGPSCPLSPDVVRAPPVSVGEVTSVDEATVIYDTGFDQQSADWTIRSGSWLIRDGSLSQIEDCGDDLAVLLQSAPVEHFSWEATMRFRTADLQGGLLFNQSSGSTRSGASIVEIVDQGSFLRWGHYDVQGYYTYQGGLAIPTVSVGQSVSLRVQVHEDKALVFMNGVQMGLMDTFNPRGYVGLVASHSGVDFDSVTLVKLPEADLGSDPAEPTTEPEVAPTPEPSSEPEQ